MLQNLHVKNLALIEETEVTFGEGINILTGETGAGKSLLIGSINLALGAKFEKDMLRRDADSALVELTFFDDSQKVKDKLEEMDLEADEDGMVIITRKLQKGKSICKINGETVTAKNVKELAEVLLDIHGQHEHQSLLLKKKHLEILDAFCGESYLRISAEVADAYHAHAKLQQALKEASMDESARERERSLAEFELQEIEQAAIVPGEDEKLEQRYRFMVNGKKIVEGLTESYGYTGSDYENGAANALGRALRALHTVSGYDERLETLAEQLTEIEYLLADYNRDISSYMEDCEFDPQDFQVVEERLNVLNRLKDKYGRTLDDVIAYAKEREAYLERLTNYDLYMENLTREVAAAAAKLQSACEALSEIRKEQALVLQAKLQEALVHLNFLTVDFEIAVRPGQAMTANGFDDVEFMISTNPGESLKPLGQIASGGELSRIMLAIKTVLAGRDDIGTLIFDEIDAGISGKTAWKVAQQLDTVGRVHQVICITHLPQIAAMADHHFCIEKSATTDHTITDTRILEEEETLAELARLLGSDTLSHAALLNAQEMRDQAAKYKDDARQNVSI